MIQKVLMGSTVVLGIAAYMLFSMLMSAKEANGMLAAEVEEAAGIVERNQKVVEVLKQNEKRLLEDFKVEQKRAEIATLKLAESRRALEREKRNAAIELSRVRASLTPEERVCADDPVPDAYFDGVPTDTSGDPGPGDN